MYTIYIKLDMNRIPQDTFDTLREKHHIWYKTYFNAGKFLMIGTCPDVSGESLIIAHGTREELKRLYNLIHIMPINWQPMKFVSTKLICSMKRLKTI